MFTARAITAQDIGGHFARQVSTYPAVRRLWVSSDIHGFDLYVLTDELDSMGEREIYRIGSLLRQKTPTVVSNILLVNPAMWPFDNEEDLISEAVPSSAIEIPLDAS